MGVFELSAVFTKVIDEMTDRVRHAEACKNPDCKCSDDPPSYCERQWVKQIDEAMSRL